MSITNLSKVKAFQTRIRKNAYIPKYYKDQMVNCLDKAINCSLKKPIIEQEVSDRFYHKNKNSSLMTGDLINLNTLNKLLTKEHQKNLKTNFGNDIYPYFFEKYQYGIIATQSCKIEQNKVHVIELCAVKPLTKIVQYLLPQKSIQARDKFIYKEEEWKNVDEKYRKLIDQQHDEFFFYPDYYENNEMKQPCLIACIDIKVPIRVKIYGIQHVETLKKARVRSINQEYRDKLGEKLGRYYLNVALEDTKDLFVETDEDFNKWIRGVITSILPALPTKKNKDDIRKFIKDNFDEKIEMNEIWDNPIHLKQILDFVQE